MDIKIALVALFSKVVPKGTDQDEAVRVLAREFARTGGQIDPAIAKDIPRDVLNWVEEFLQEPADFIIQFATDSRVANWQKLAGAATPPAPVPTSSRPAVSPPAGAVATLPAPSSPAPAAARSLSVSALRGARVGSTAPTLGGLSVSRTDVDSSRPKRDRDKQFSAGKASQPADKAQFVPAPDLVHGFQSVQDLGRVGGELVRERTAATRRETPGAQKKRLDAEAAERQRRLDEDARERQRRQTEEEEALRRRLAIEAEADERKRLADLRLAAEKQRLDDEAEERREERKRAREEARERKPPEPPPDRNLPPLGMMVIQSPTYIDLRNRLMTAVQRERRGEDGAQDEVRQLGREIIRLAGSNNRLEELAGGMLHRLRRSLAEWQDVHDPKAFQASYITGIYPD